MPPAPETADADFRSAGPAALALALCASRRDTLASLARFEAHLPGLQVPPWGTLNPPLWELGHIHWFQQYWLARYPQAQRRLGCRANPHIDRIPALAPDSDALFDSSHVTHTSRWTLPLPRLDALREALAAGQTSSLQLLTEIDSHKADDEALYFHRLVLAHEDMHHEAALYMAQALGLPLHDPRWLPLPQTQPRQTLHFEAIDWNPRWPGDGFAFDNELGAQRRQLPNSRIDSRVLSWADYLPFVEAGGYQDSRCWTEAGLAWLQSSGAAGPRYLRRPDPASTAAEPEGPGTQWQQQIGGRWQPLNPQLPACHLNAHEAQAWCQWAGRRLPLEAEWERAAVQGGADFVWGQVWEWTASAFEPYPGFVAHPYRDYSAPWFGSRRVLRGASFATQPRLRHARYRNFYTPERNDIFAGFRSCAM